MNRAPWPQRRWRPPIRNLAWRLTGKKAPKEAQPCRTRYQKEWTSKYRLTPRTRSLRVSLSPRLVLGAWTRRPGETESSFSTAMPGEMELSIPMTLQFRRLRTGAVGGDVRSAGGGNWTWSGARSAKNGYARCDAGQEMILGAGAVFQILRVECLDGEVGERRPGQWASSEGGELAVRRSSLLNKAAWSR